MAMVLWKILTISTKCIIHQKDIGFQKDLEKVIIDKGKRREKVQNLLKQRMEIFTKLLSENI